MLVLLHSSLEPVFSPNIGKLIERLYSTRSNVSSGNLCFENDESVLGCEPITYKLMWTLELWAEMMNHRHIQQRKPIYIYIYQGKNKHNAQREVKMNFHEAQEI